MNRFKLSIFALLFVSMSASAEDGGWDAHRNGGLGVGVGVGISSSTSTSTSDSSATSNSGGNVQSINIESNKRSASTAYAGTVYPTAMCMGSSSGGVQSTVFGFSAASSWTDKNCMVLEQARSAATVLGDKAVAEEIMCSLKEYREARNRIGNPCVTDKK